MTDARRSRLLTLAAVAGAALGLVFAATSPGPSQLAPPGSGFGPGPVTAGVAVTAGWGEVADVVPGIDPNSTNSCQSGADTCLDRVIGEMEARLEILGCAHTAPFAFTYLEMTRDVGRRVAEPDFFVAPEVVAQLDAIFASLYFDAIDNWAAGRREEVPPAWRMAFSAAEGGRTSPAADLFLGMNAHISRDLAYAVAELLAADAAASPTDFLLVNEVIAEVQGPMLDGAALRFDPQLSELSSLLPADVGITTVDLIARWRQQAFEMGRRLARASSAEEAELVAAEIERTAVAAAVMILNADSALAAEGEPLDRDAYCEANRR